VPAPRPDTGNLSKICFSAGEGAVLTPKAARDRKGPDVGPAFGVAPQSINSLPLPGRKKAKALPWTRWGLEAPDPHSFSGGRRRPVHGLKEDGGRGLRLTSL
jgi:hypothetical protein